MSTTYRCVFWPRVRIHKTTLVIHLSLCERIFSRKTTKRNMYEGLRSEGCCDRTLPPLLSDPTNAFPPRTRVWHGPPASADGRWHLISHWSPWQNTRTPATHAWTGGGGSCPCVMFSCPLCNVASIPRKSVCCTTRRISLARRLQWSAKACGTFYSRKVKKR